MVRSMCGVLSKDRKIVKDLMLLLGLNETTDQMVMVNNVPINGHMLRNEDFHASRRTLDS